MSWTIEVENIRAGRFACTRCAWRGTGAQGTIPKGCTVVFCPRCWWPLRRQPEAARAAARRYPRYRRIA